LAAVALIPLVALYLHHRARRALRLGIALLDLAAHQLGLIKLDPPRKTRQPSSESGPAAAA
jgi:hypothetical protein